MLYLRFTIPIFIFATQVFGQTPQSLFPFREGSMWGFIDSTGKEVIPAKYLNAGDFSEGLAPVRVAGRYGYINFMGKLQIKARFDYAEPFLNGLGKVWSNGKPFFVNKTGQLTYAHPFIKIDGFEAGSECAIITVKNQIIDPWSQAKMGLMNREGKLLIDTLFSQVMKWTSNRYICYFRQEDSIIVTLSNSTNPYNKTYPAICVLDSNGNVVVPTGIYSKIKRADNNLASIEEIGDTSRNPSKFIALNGNVLSFPPERRHEIGKSRFEWSENRASGRMLSIPYRQWAQEGHREETLITGWFDDEGRFIHPDTLLEFASPFHNGRAFGRCKRIKFGERERYYLYDHLGNQVGNRSFQHFLPFWDEKQNLSLGFWEGVAVVLTDSGTFEMIDTMGNTLQQLGKHYSMQIIIKPRVKIWGFNDPGSATLIWDCTKKMFLEKQLFGIDLESNHENFLIRGGDFFGKLKYMDRTGKIVWEEKPETSYKKRSKLNTDQLLSGISFTKKTIAQTNQISLPEGLSFTIRLNDSTAYLSKYLAYPTYFTNNTKDSILVRFVYTLQVLNLNKEWQDILYHPVTFCGVGEKKEDYLKPGECLEFVIPDFDGEIETQMRLGVIVDGKWLFSNAIRTHINPGQLWRKPIYSRIGMLQRYTETHW